MTKIRKLIFLLVDCVSVTFALHAAIWLKYDTLAPEHLHHLILMVVIFIPISIATYWIMGLYNRTLRFTSISDMVAVFIAVSINTSLKFFSLALTDNKSPLVSVIIIDWMINLILTGLFRITPRMFLIFADSVDFNTLFSHTSPKTHKNVMIVGAGRAGESIVREIKQNSMFSINLIGLIDDDPKKSGQIIHGVPVLGNTRRISALVKNYSVDELLIAIPSATGQELRRIMQLCQDSQVRFKTLPGLKDMIDGKLSALQMRDIAIEDLLRRPPAEINLAEIAAYVTNKIILVTGAGGSIGSEICRQILPFQPDAILLLGHGENSIYNSLQDLSNNPELGNTKLVPLIADIQDKQKIERVFKAYTPQIVFHAAAHKHVPLMEINPEEAVKNNIIGTLNLVDAAHGHDAERFVMISTDKAVNPTSVMGATKRVAEKVLKCYAKRSGTRFVAVRFGNVLGSRGSVIPLFKKQIETGGPVTITHPKMIRYFMTIPEASKLTIQAGAYGKGGEVFVLDMGNPVRIQDLAEDLIRLSGLETGKDIKIQYSGIRPGEKLFEELLTASEGITATRNSKIFIAKPEEVDESELRTQILKLEAYADSGRSKKIISLLKDIIPSFTPNRDMIYQEQQRKGTTEQDFMLSSEGAPKLRVIEG